MLNIISKLFADNAWAMAPNPSGGGGGGALAGLLPILLIFVIFYFLLIRPQQKKQKEHQAMVTNLKKGDKVITSGGVYGLVEQVGEKTVTLKVGENTKVKFGKQYIAAIRSTADEE
jgi:preprotein translocase subunit YajC